MLKLSDAQAPPGFCRFVSPVRRVRSVLQRELFDCVWIDEDERGRLETLGLNITRNEDGRPRFDLPCRHYSGNCCQIYPERPTTCRTFRCKLLIAYEDGEVEEADALKRIAEAQNMIEKARALLKSGQALRPATWKAMIVRWHRESGSATLSPTFAARFLALTRLNRFFYAHFRNEDPPVGKDGRGGA